MYLALQIWRRQQVAWVQIFNTALFIGNSRWCTWLLPWRLESWKQAVHLIGVMVSNTASNESILRIACKIRQKRPILIVSDLLYTDWIERRLCVIVAIFKHMVKPVRLDTAVPFWACFFDYWIWLLQGFLINRLLLRRFAQHVSKRKLFFGRLLCLIVERKFAAWVLFNEHRLEVAFSLKVSLWSDWSLIKCTFLHFWCV